MREFMQAVLKAVYGTDEHCRMESREIMSKKPTPPNGHATEKLAELTERKIEGMKKATERLSELSAAGNLSEAVDQIVWRRGRNG